jgi:DnaJ-domain-containing protein 1
MEAPRLDPATAKSLLYLGEIALGVMILLYVLFGKSRGPESRFRVREADRAAPGTRGSGPDALGQARIERPKILQLTGFRLDGEPHEILGVPREAPAAEVQRAYKDLMKRFHPDKIGPPGSREWTDAKKIAEAINRARDRMLKKS